MTVGLSLERVSPGLEEVARAFADNFANSGELGAAFAAYSGDTPLVDLWGGIADSQTGAPWAEETLQIVFSGTKGLVALCVLMLVDRGLIELETPVARYWPEFEAAGKATVTVRQVLSHHARLPGLEHPVSWQEATQGSRMASLLAAQPQSADRRATATYHPLTFGWICGEVILRVTGRTVGRFFADEVARPLGLDLWIGLPADQESRVACVELAADWESRPSNAEEVDDPLTRSIANPRRYEPEKHFPWNDPNWHAAEVPGANAIGRRDRSLGCTRTYRVS